MRRASDPTEEQFLHDVRDHRMTIAWGIRQYDEATELPAMAEKDCA